MKRTIKLVILTSLMLGSNSFAVNKNLNISPADREKIETVTHDYLLKNPEILIEAMQILQQKQFQQTEKTIQQTQKDAASFANPLFHQANDPIIGNPNGKITLVEFFDYQCPHCLEMSPVISEIVKKNPNLRVIYKEFPIRGPISEFAAKAALAANKQGKYEVFSRALLNAAPPLSQETILKVAKESGLDVDKLKKDMEDNGIKKQLENNIKLAKDLKLMGTPAIFVGKTQAKGKDAITYIPGKIDQQKLQDTLNNFN